MQTGAMAEMEMAPTSTIWGNVYNSASFRCFGPGGGGGGGLVWFKGSSTPSGISISNAGGIFWSSF